jgi:hypothetical protein
MLVGDRDRHLGLDLHQLVFHVQHDLLDHLLGMLRPVDEIVEICANQCGYTF